MKELAFALTLILFGIGCGNQLASGSNEEQVVEASCGQCLFGMGKEGCDLAVRINGKGYFVDGTGIDDHGDSHGEDGFCNKIRRAKVSGEIKGDRFKVTSFKLLPLEKKDSE